ncbi:MAG: cupin domain-containing protein [Actinobacteria bacterium]|nr:cupin domain-containing protein [Actinomycetota bacterium]
MGFSVARVDEIEPKGPGGAVRFVRRELGVQAFGVNWFEIPAGATGREHDETSSGQEEVYVVVRGDGTWRIDGEDVSVSAGTVLRVDPESTRCPVAGPAGLTFLAIGAPCGAYEPRGPF